MKNRKKDWNWRFNKDNKSKAYVELQGTTVEERTKYFLELYWHDYNLRKRESEKNNIKTEAKVCIARADSGLWTYLKTAFNYGNIWNDDRGTRVHFASPEQWIRAIGSLWLNGKYLKNKQTIGDLSRAGDCKIDCTKFYATSVSNRQNNSLNCLSNLYNRQINADFIFRK